MFWINTLRYSTVAFRLSSGNISTTGSLVSLQINNAKWKILFLCIIIAIFWTDCKRSDHFVIKNVWHCQDCLCSKIKSLIVNIQKHGAVLCPYRDIQTIYLRFMFIRSIKLQQKGMYRMWRALRRPRLWTLFTEFFLRLTDFFHINFFYLDEGRALNNHFCCVHSWVKTSWMFISKMLILTGFSWKTICRSHLKSKGLKAEKTKSESFS